MHSFYYYIPKQGIYDTNLMLNFLGATVYAFPESWQIFGSRLDVRGAAGNLVRVRIFPRLIVGFSGPRFKQDVDYIASYQHVK